MSAERMPWPQLPRNPLPRVGSRVRRMPLQSPPPSPYWPCPEPQIAMKKWYDVKPNFDMTKMVARLKVETDKKEIVRLLLGFHIRFWHAPVPDMIVFLKSAECWTKLLATIIVLIPMACTICRDYARQLTRPQVGITIAIRFNHRVQMDLFFMWDKTWILIIDELSRYKVTDMLKDKTPKELLTCLMRSWIRYFGPMQIMVLDQEGGMVSELASRMCDKMNIKRRFAGTDDHTMTGLVDESKLVGEETSDQLSALWAWQAHRSRAV